ncbi:MAG TPA: hypothetical protein VMI31_00335, partial [Fimbriimonadaceae bacterium]|nr:hypothetical protein [Fimbriimonadaceae bacterium]
MLALLAAIALQTPRSGGLPGIDEAMREVRAVAARSKAPVGGRFAVELDRYKATSGAMSAADAARAWLVLFDDWRKAKQTPGLTSDDLDALGQTPEIVLDALPEPETWPLIRNGLNGADPVAIVLDHLIGDDRAVIDECERKRTRSTDWNTLDRVELAAALGTHDQVLAAKILARAIAASDRPSLPPLVEILGEERAKPILWALLHTLHGDFAEVHGPRTKRLGRELVLGGLDKISTPFWSLADGPESTDYLLKLIAKFGDQSLLSSNDADGEALYLSYLRTSGRTADIVRIAKNERLPEDALPIDPTALTELFDGMMKAFRQSPAAVDVQYVARVARSLGRASEVRQVLLDARRRKDTGNHDRTVLTWDLGLFDSQAGDLAAAIRDFAAGAAMPEDPNDYRGMCRMALRDLAKDTGDPRALAALGQQGSVDALIRAGRLADAQHLLIDQFAAPGWKIQA